MTFFKTIFLILALALSAHGADKKISELNSLPAASWATGDLFPVVDVSSTETKKTTVADFDTRYLRSGFLGSFQYATTANCLFQNSSATFANIAADSDCPTATIVGTHITASGTKIPGFVLDSVAAGDVITIYASSEFYGNSTSCAWRMHDGTSGAGYMFTSSGATSHTLVSTFVYSGSASSITYRLQSMNGAGVNNCEIYVNDAGSLQQPLLFTVYRNVSL